MYSIFDINNKSIVIFKKTNGLYSMILPEKNKDFGVLTTEVSLENLDVNNPASYINICQKFRKNGILFDFIKKEIHATDVDEIRKEFKFLDLRIFTYDDYANFFLD